MTVQIDAVPAVNATLKHIPNRQLVIVNFTATVQITSGTDPHTLTVTVNSDAGVPVTKVLTVTAGPRLEAPAVLIDLVTAYSIDPSKPDVQKYLSSIAKRIESMSLIGKLASINKVVVGPSALQVSETTTPRIGLWILDANFPENELQQPSQDFPLPRLTLDVAAQSFGLAPPPNVPVLPFVDPASLPMFSFALSVPTGTLQLILDAMMPDLVSKAAEKDFTLNKATVQVDGSGAVTTVFSGLLPGSVPTTARLTEDLGISQRPGTVQHMPAVVSSSNSVSAGSDLQWFAGWFVSLFVPKVGLLLLAALGLVEYGVGEVSGAVTGVLSSFLQRLPARISFRNKGLPQSLQAEFPFPMAVANFASFSTDGSGIVATGEIGLGGRDQSMVTVSLIGPSYFPNYTRGVESAYNVVLTHFEPDDDQMNWQISDVARSLTVAIDSFWQEGYFSPDFPLPARAAPGKYHYTVSVSGTETCASDVTKTLSGSASLSVTVNVTGGPPL
ncbi:MAG TPA: hypothetical protein VGS20_03100 [Candidatus Acidoferrales bacterium]|nr:hypothetical protein [Candidatus Acidoferrales bacterium]